MADDTPSSTPETFDDYLTVNEIAATLKVNPMSVRNWITDGQLRAVRVGQRRIRVLRADLDAFLAHEPTSPPEPVRDAVSDELAELREQLKGLRARVALLEQTVDNLPNTRLSVP